MISTGYTYDDVEVQYIDRQINVVPKGAKLYPTRGFKYSLIVMPENVSPGEGLGLGFVTVSTIGYDDVSEWMSKQ